MPGIDLAVELGQRPAHVARDGRVQHDAEQLRGRRLAVRAGDADEPRLEQPVAELDLAPDRHASALGLRHERRLARNPGALHQQLGPVEQSEVAVVAELAVGADDLHPAPLERRRRRLPRPSEPEHEHPLRQHAQRNPVK